MQMRDPSPSKRRFASESSRVPLVCQCLMRLVVSCIPYHRCCIGSNRCAIEIQPAPEVCVSARSLRLLHLALLTNALPSSKISLHPLHGYLAIVSRAMRERSLTYVHDIVLVACVRRRLSLDYVRHLGEVARSISYFAEDMLPERTIGETACGLCRLVARSTSLVRYRVDV